KRELFDFHQCVEDVLGGIRQQAASKNVALANEIQSQQTLYADRVRVKEILYNLLSNALKFSLEGGRVWVEGAREGDFLHVTVCDRGIGIAEQELASIFDKFYQVKDLKDVSREGTGLGLPITKHLVELHGGTIRVESRPGHGSRFKLTFPAVK